MREYSHKHLPSCFGFNKENIKENMFSNDNNIESIAQLIEVLKHYIGLRSEYIKLDVIEKTVRLLTVLVVTAVLFLLLIISLIYLSFAAAFALEPYTGIVGAFSIVGGVYFLILIVFVLCRKRLIEKPLVHFLASILMSK